MQLQERLPLLFGNLAVGDEGVDEGDAAKFMDGMLSRQDPPRAVLPAYLPEYTFSRWTPTSPKGMRR